MNVFAVEVHQRETASSDLGFDLGVTLLSTFNNPPTIGNIANQSITVGGSSGAIAFTVGDVETPVANLAVAATSSNTTLVPNASIVFGGAGANRAVTVLPAGLIAEDHFLIGGNRAAGEYAEANLGGQNPTLLGWNSAWVKVGTNDVQGNAIGLDYTGLQTAGGRATVPDGTRSGHVLATGFDAATSGTFYMAFLMRLDGDDSNAYRAFGLHNGGFDDNGNRVLRLGQHAGDLGTAGYGIRINNSFTADLGAMDGNANMFVLKFTFSTDPNGDSVTEWRNPASIGGAEPAGGTTLTGFDLAFDRSSLAHYIGGGSGQFIVYEFEDSTLQGWTNIRSNTDYSPRV